MVPWSKVTGPQLPKVLLDKVLLGSLQTGGPGKRAEAPLGGAQNKASPVHSLLTGAPRLVRPGEGMCSGSMILDPHLPVQVTDDAKA